MFGPNLPSKHSVGHILDPCLSSSAFFQPPQITNGILYPYAHFVNHSCCHQHPYNTLVFGPANRVAILSVTGLMKVLIIKTLLLQSFVFFPMPSFKSAMEGSDSLNCLKILSLTSCRRFSHWCHEGTDQQDTCAQGVCLLPNAVF
ncbi:hypothetical protein O181_113271 [Austropuccinia psidii MF-1]|uniref:Uncharacterized protein n=1 Tax=Austropuccinia psidii MF-1 TaxID=1389203 RepID=A0A9Q3K405_9BASI|nr:hypothetical protein [Austropuccinia psidii MF-1]